MDIDPIKFGVTWQKVETMEAEMAEIKKDVTKFCKKYPIYPKV